MIEIILFHSLSGISALRRTEIHRHASDSVQQSASSAAGGHAAADSSIMTSAADDDIDSASVMQSSVVNPHFSRSVLYDSGDPFATLNKSALKCRETFISVLP